MKLTKIKTIRFSEGDVYFMDKLQELNIKSDSFLRTAFREKIERELKHLIQKQEEIDKDLPF